MCVKIRCLVHGLGLIEVELVFCSFSLSSCLRLHWNWYVCSSGGLVGVFFLSTVIKVNLKKSVDSLTQVVC